MAYSVNWAGGGAEEIEEIAAFLSSFDSDGGSPRVNQAQELWTWKKRMSSWWNKNPYQSEATPKGLILRSSDGTICGFLGLIAHDYTLRGERIPSLSLTTHFVKVGHRSAAFPLFLRALRLSSQYQLVDGTPNEEAKTFLERSGFKQIERRSVLAYPTMPRFLRGWIGRTLIGIDRISPHPPSFWNRGLVRKMDQFKGIDHEPCPEKLQKHLDVETLKWYIDSGSEEKIFAGWADDSGMLQCFVIGIRTKVFGVNSILILEASANSKLGEGAVPSFLSYLTSASVSPHLMSGSRVVFLPLSPDLSPPFLHAIIRFRRQFPIFHKLPETSIACGCERVAQLSEGDRLFL